MTKRYLTLLLLFYFSSGQVPKWVEFISDEKGNYQEALQDFNNYWKNRKRQRGDGYKPFMRYATFLENRMDKKEHFDPIAPLKAKRQLEAAKTQNFGNWIPLGPTYWAAPYSWSYNPGVGRVNDIAKPSANSSEIFVATPSGGLWYSSNNGTTWSNLTDTLPVIGASSIVINPNNPNIIYFASGDGDGGDTYSLGVYKSTDGGQTWYLTNLTFSLSNARRIYKLLMHPTNPDIIFAVGNIGIWKTTDGGNSWTQVATYNVKDIEFHPTNPNIVYACGSSFYKSTEGGNNWTTITSGLPSSSSVSRMAIATTPAAPNNVYLLAGDAYSYLKGFYKSTDSGNNFNLMMDMSSGPNILGYRTYGSDSSGQAWYDLSIAAHPTDSNIVYTGGINIWKTTDGGSNWQIVTHWYHYSGMAYPYVHADIHQLKFIGNSLFAGCDGGIFVSNDFGNTWQDLSDGLEITQFYRFSNTNSKILGGAQDVGMNLYEGSFTWKHVRGADGMEAYVSPTNPSRMYSCSQNGGLSRSDNGGQSWTYIADTIKDAMGERGRWVTPIAVHPQNDDIIIAGYENIWVSTDAGNSWSKKTMRSYPSDPLFNGIDISTKNPNVLYAITGSEVLQSYDGGNNWYDITSALYFGPVAKKYSYVKIAPWDENVVFIANGNSSHKVYYTTDGGISWNYINTGLPDISVNCIEYDSVSKGVYAGTDLGVYYLDSTFSQWIPFFEGLPNVGVSELEVINGKLRAATYGRGVWESDLYSSLATKIVKNNSSAKVFPNPAEYFITFSFLDNSPKKLRVYSLEGKLVFEKDIMSSEFVLDSKDLSGAGTYIYEVFYNNSRKETGKIVFLR